jgi:methionyl-tRNA formyltransferase
VTPLRLVFAGTPGFALPCLQALIGGPDRLLAVYTQPDRPAGRGRALTPSPVKQAALAAGIEVRQPASLRDAAAQGELAALAPDLMIVVAYGLILPPAVLAIPRHGCWNVHASLLPRWRGAAPIQRAIEAGDAETGVCLMRMEAGLDTGPVLIARREPIAPEDTAGSLHDRLAALGATLLEEGLAALRAGTLPAPAPQPTTGVTYARKIEKSEAALDPARPARELAARVRAFQPWPVATLTLEGDLLRVHAAQALDLDHGQPPGTVLAASRAGIDIACGVGALRLTRLQRPGGRLLSAAEYLNARPDLHR